MSHITGHNLNPISISLDHIIFQMILSIETHTLNITHMLERICKDLEIIIIILHIQKDDSKPRKEVPKDQNTIEIIDLILG